MNKTLLTVVLLLCSPLVLGWNQAECEEVNWLHPDCSWGVPIVPSPPEDDESSQNSSTPSIMHPSSGGHNSFSRRTWIVDLVDECWSFRAERRGVYTLYHYAIITPPNFYPGEPTIIHFHDRKKTVCTVWEYAGQSLLKNNSEWGETYMWPSDPVCEIHSYKWGSRYVEVTKVSCGSIDRRFNLTNSSSVYEFYNGSLKHIVGIKNGTAMTFETGCNECYRAPTKREVDAFMCGSTGACYP